MVVVVDKVVVDIVEVTCEATNVTGRSLVSMMLVEAMEELKNLEVILLTSFFISVTVVFRAGASVSSKDDSLGLGVIGILLLDLDRLIEAVRKSKERKMCACHIKVEATTSKSFPIRCLEWEYMVLFHYHRMCASRKGKSLRAPKRRALLTDSLEKESFFSRIPSFPLLSFNIKSRKKSPGNVEVVILSRSRSREQKNWASKYFPVAGQGSPREPGKSVELANASQDGFPSHL